MRTVLDKRLVADLTFEAKPVFDGAGKLTGTAPNKKRVAYDVHDTHKDSPTGFRLRVSRTVKTYVLVQRQGGKVVTTTVGRHPDLLIGKEVAPDRNARLVAAELSSRVRRGEDVNQTRRAAKVAATVGSPTLRVLFNKWLEDYQTDAKRDPRQNTLAAVHKAMDRLGEKLLDRQADDITWRDLEGFFKDKATTQGHLTAAEQTIRWVSTVYNNEPHRVSRRPVGLSQAGMA